MKKNTKLIFASIFLVGSLFVGGETEAATFEVAMPAGELIAGREYRLPVRVVPASGEKVYTAQILLSAGLDKMTLKNFEFAPDWLPLKQAGYDLLDPTTGRLIKTAGFAGGLDKSMLLGTLVVVPKGTGSGLIEVNSGAQILDAQNQNLLKVLPKFSFVVKESLPVVAEKKNQIVSQNLAAQDELLLAEKSRLIEEEDLATATSASQVALSGILGLSWSMILGILLVVVIVLLAVDIFFRNQIKK